MPGDVNASLAKNRRLSVRPNFLLSFNLLSSFQARLAQESFLLHAVPGYAPCSHSRSRTLTIFWLRSRFVTRHCTCAQNRAPERGQILTPKLHCTATAPVRNKFPAVTAKTRAIPGLHREKFLAKVPGRCPDAAPGTAYELYRRAVIANADNTLDNFVISFL